MAPAAAGVGKKRKGGKKKGAKKGKSKKAAGYHSTGQSLKVFADDKGDRYVRQKSGNHLVYRAL